MKKTIMWIFSLVMLLSALLLSASANNFIITDTYIDDLFVYDFMRGEDGKFERLKVKVTTSFDDESTGEKIVDAYCNGSVEYDYGTLTLSDSQAEELWEAGNTYQVSYGDGKTFNVEVRENPIASIEIKDCGLCIFNEDYGAYEYSPSCTVYYTDGSVEEDVSGVSLEDNYYDGYFYEIEFSDSQSDEPWEEGETYEVTGTLLGVSDTFDVTVVTVQDIEIGDIEYIEGTGYMDSYEDEEGESAWMYYDIYPDEITVIFSDGESLSGELCEIEEITGFGVNCYSDQSYENQWGVGEHTATLEFLGFIKEYTVTISETPIEKIEIEDVSVIEYTHGYPDGEIYYYYPDIKATITFKDGSVTVTEETEIEIDDRWFEIDIDTSAQHEEPWTVGNTYAVTGTLLGVSDTFGVTILETPVRSIEIEDISILEYTCGYEEEEYFHYDPNIKATITLKDGTVINDTYINLEDGQYHIDIDTSSQGEEPWTAGNTYTVTGTLLGVSDTFEVTIIESPVKSITLNDVVLYEGIDSYGDEGNYRYSFSTVLSEVILKDGTKAELKDGYFMYDGELYGVSDNAWDMQDEEPWSAGRTYKVKGSLFGAEATFKVMIKENLIEKIELAKMPDKTEYLIGEALNLKGATVRVFYTDGTYEDFSVDEDYTRAYRRSVYSEKIDRKSDLLSYGSFENTGLQTAELTLFGKTCELAGVVKANPADVITIKEDEDKSLIITVYNTDATSYDMKLLDIAYLWPWDENVYYSSVFTDKGNFGARIYTKNDLFAIGLDIGGKHIKSNFVPRSEWFKTAVHMADSCFYWLADSEVSYEGNISSDNIDFIIEMVCGFGGHGFYEDKAIVWANTYADFKGQDIRERVKKYFAVEDVDLTLSEHYDSLTDTYRCVNPRVALGEVMKYCPDSIDYSDGIWSVTTAVESHNFTGKKTINIKLNDELKITGFSFNMPVKTVSSVAITEKPDKTEYTEGNPLDTRGMTVTAYYSDGTSEVITGYSLSGYTSTPGKKTVTVSFAGKTDTFEVVVMCGEFYTDSCDTTCNLCGTTRKITHTYSNACDGECNVCKAKRKPSVHKYSNSCDTTCNSCNAKRSIKHTYSNSCDKECNVCKAKRSIKHSYTSVTTKATLKKNGKTVTKCSVCGYTSGTVTIYKIKSVKLSADEYAYNGKTKTPSVTVKDSKGKVLKKGTDYTVTYPKKRKSVGKYTVTVTFKGNYSGSKTLTFSIKPAKTEALKLTAKDNALALSWKTVKGADGYEIQYSTSKKFTKKTTKTTLIKKQKTKKTTLKKLKNKKKYYVKVRAYKTVNGKKIYGAWSTVKSVKVK